MPHPKAFVIWAHTSPGWDRARTDAWRDTVHRFVTLLRGFGVDAEVDLFHLHERLDWSKWCLAAMEDADTIVIAVSHGWRLAYGGRYPESVGAGIEIAHLQGLRLQEPATFQRKVVVVVLPGASTDDIPPSLWSVPHFVVDPADASTATTFRHLLHDEPVYVKPPVVQKITAETLLAATVFLPDPGEPGLLVTDVAGYGRWICGFSDLDRLIAYRRLTGAPWQDRWLEVDGAELCQFVAPLEVGLAIDAGDDGFFVSSADVLALTR